MQNRVLAQFSCGAASAVATKLALAEFGDRSEHVPSCGLICESAEALYAA